MKHLNNLPNHVNEFPVSKAAFFLPVKSAASLRFSSASLFSAFGSSAKL